MTAPAFQVLRSFTAVAFLFGLCVVSAANSGTAVFQTTVNGSDVGACAYGPVAKTAYGPLNFAGSATFYGGGANCGECFQVVCTVKGVCSSTGVTVTQTDFCSGTTVCSSTSVTVALSGYAYNKMAVAGEEAALEKLGKVPITYTRVPCVYPATTTIKFRVLSSYNGYYFPLSVINVGGPGALTGVSIMPGAGTAFIALVRQYGEIWVPPTGAGLIVGPVTVKLTATIAGKATTVVCPTKIPASFNYKVATYYPCGAQFPASI